MSFQKYLQTISQIGSGKIYVENVRNALRVSAHKAKVYCEMAVADNLFERKIGLVCPNDNRIIAEFDSESEMPISITCIVCSAEGIEPDTFKVSELSKITYYKLNHHVNSLQTPNKGGS